MTEEIKSESNNEYLANQDTEYSRAYEKELIKHDEYMAQILQRQESHMLEEWQKLKFGETEDFPIELFKNTTFVFTPPEKKEKKHVVLRAKQSLTDQNNSLTEIIEEKKKTIKNKPISQLKKLIK
jgi:hypothetical protein